MFELLCSQPTSLVVVLKLNMIQFYVKLDRMEVSVATY
ncbi:hypothetical protein CK203_012108 [Vitis vinifera]|uniref:Uncharacterized protein n=1 Tax=Vitis vinifera TaxID=29760 RepID=A0A438K0A5_VITVI|nr:hypothetical protein CK203_012108 [Vitis vinifera]